MRITQISLENFRNYSSYTFSPHSYINVFTGDNGQGKTSVLESLSLALTGMSFRKGRNWVQKDKDWAKIFLKFTSSCGDGEILLAFSKNNIFQMEINKKKTNKRPFQSLCVFFTPEDLGAVRGGADRRRKLVDDLVQNESPLVYRKFYKVLSQKNRFLKLCRQGYYSSLDQKNYHQALQPVFIQTAFELIQARFRVLSQIQPFWEKRGLEFLQTRQFSLKYVVRKGLSADSPESALESLEKEMKEKSALERIQGCCLAGPQRHDFRFLCHKQEAQEGLSQGQQKALLISWKMAQWDWVLQKSGEQPCLFFDDAFSEIDQQFHKNLIQFLLENQTQSFVAASVWAQSLSPERGCLFNLGKRSERYNDREAFS